MRGIREGRPGAEPQPQANVDQQTKNQNENQQENSSSVKEQGGLSAGGVPVNENAQADPDKLRNLQERTRKGDLWALAERLQGAPHVGTPTSSEEIGEE